MLFFLPFWIFKKVFWQSHIGKVLNNFRYKSKKIACLFLLKSFKLCVEMNYVFWNFQFSLYFVCRVELFWLEYWQLEKEIPIKTKLKPHPVSIFMPLTLFHKNSLNGTDFYKCDFKSLNPRNSIWNFRFH